VNGAIGYYHRGEFLVHEKRNASEIIASNAVFVLSQASAGFASAP